MAEAKKINLYKNILGDAKATIDAIQKYIKDNAVSKNKKEETEEIPALSIKKILASISDEETSAEIQKIIDSL